MQSILCLQLLWQYTRYQYYFLSGSCHGYVQSVLSTFLIQRTKLHTEFPCTIRSIGHREENNIALISLNIFNIFDKQRRRPKHTGLCKPGLQQFVYPLRLSEVKRYYTKTAFWFFFAILQYQSHHFLCFQLVALLIPYAIYLNIFYRLTRTSNVFFIREESEFTLIEILV